MKKLYLMLLVMIACVYSQTAEAAPNIQKVTTPAGLQLWLVSSPRVPVIALSFSFKGGMIYDPPGKEGLAYMATALLDQGAGELDTESFNRRLTENSISMGFSAGRDWISGSVYGLKSHQDMAFPLLRSALTAPMFAPSSVERVRGQIQAQIANNLSQPSWIAARVFNEKNFIGHPYSQPGQGTPESIKNITVDDLRQFAKTRLVKKHLLITVAGDTTPEEIAPIVDNIFAGLPEGEDSPPVADISPQAAGKLFVVNLPLPQSFVQFAQDGISPQSPDYHAALIINHVLGGGGFDSRLMDNIREKNGLTYGVSTGLTNMEHASLLGGAYSSDNQKVLEALKKLKEEWALMAEKGITPEELQHAQQFLKGSFALEMTSTREISGLLLALRQLGRDPDYINQRNGLIDKVTVADIKNLAKKWLDPKHVGVVLVGNPPAIEGAESVPVPFAEMLKKAAEVAKEEPKPIAPVVVNPPPPAAEKPAASPQPAQSLD
ncbi:MAG: M16 family metallopeptidase [Alphaproteobacteria bacterium]